MSSLHSVLHPVVQYYTDHVQQVVDLTVTLANYETPTADKASVDLLGRYIADYCANLGAHVTNIPREAVGDIHLAQWHTDLPGKPVLFLMHIDTVWPLGTLATRPVHIEGDRLIGPGTWDMKGSIACVLNAIRGLRDRKEFPQRPVWCLFTTDEETGSAHSWEIIEQYAKQAGLCLVMEFASPNSGLKTWRKGIAVYTVTVKGRSSHAGNAPEKGINAVVELAHQTLNMTALNNPEHGTSVSVTVVNGGTAFNVIPDSATAKVDVRFKLKSERDRVDAAIMNLQPVLKDAQISATMGSARPPMERDETMDHAFSQARALTAAMGYELFEDGSGGGSDGNITAALGIPTLDGLGPSGEGAHALHEQVVISSIPARVALLDRIIAEWVF